LSALLLGRQRKLSRKIRRRRGIAGILQSSPNLRAATRVILATAPLGYKSATVPDSVIFGCKTGGRSKKLCLAVIGNSRLEEVISPLTHLCWPDLLTPHGGPHMRPSNHRRLACLISQSVGIGVNRDVHGTCHSWKPRTITRSSTSSRSSFQFLLCHISPVIVASHLRTHIPDGAAHHYLVTMVSTS